MTCGLVLINPTNRTAKTNNESPITGVSHTVHLHGCMDAWMRGCVDACNATSSHGPLVKTLTGTAVVFFGRHMAACIHRGQGYSRVGLGVLINAVAGSRPKDLALERSISLAHDNSPLLHPPPTRDGEVEDDIL